DRQGDQVALAMVKEDGAPSVFLWATLDELRAYPIITDTPTGTITPIGRPLWFGFYDFTPTAPPPHNCDLYVGPGGDGIVRSVDGRALAHYIAATSDSDLDELNALL